VHHQPPIKSLFLVLSYNAGRIITYSLFGSVAGLLGQGFFMAGYQQALSVIIGVLLLISVILPFIFGIPKFHGSPMLNGLLLNTRSKLSSLFQKKGHRPMFLIGLLNGLLPCGLVYMGIAGALTTGSVLKGAFFMASFGLGTLPFMIIIPMTGKFISATARTNMRKAIPVFITFTALLLILRGLNLGIPFVSPKLDHNQMPACHARITPSKQHLILCTGHDSQHKK
jgi:sulfite exporter TauE/SafE